MAVHFITTSLSVSAELPNALEYSRSRYSGGVTFAAYESISDDAYRKALGVYTELDTAYIEKIGELRPVMINERYFDVYGIHIGGSGITKQHLDNRVKAVVISDAAARSMSLDGNAVGRTISLLGSEYMVVGIYHKPDGFLREAASDVYERVYIPYTCVDGYRDTPIDTITATIGTHSEKSLSLLGLTETNTRLYLRNDLGVKHDILSNLPSLFISILGVILAVIALIQIVKIGRQTADKLRADQQNDYLSGVIKKSRKYLILRILLILLLTAVPTAILILFPPRLILPLSFIPQDNLFDVGHYLTELTKTLQYIHTNIRCGNDYLTNLFWSAWPICVVEFLLSLIGSCYLIIRLYRIRSVTRQ